MLNAKTSKNQPKFITCRSAMVFGLGTTTPLLLAGIFVAPVLGAARKELLATTAEALNLLWGYFWF
jgi:sulfite exporter TauE/SafE